MIHIGIICPSEIAFRRFMPALKQCAEMEYMGVAVASEKEWMESGTGQTDKVHVGQILESELEKAKNFQNTYGGDIYMGYERMLSDENIDAVYIPLPPALHYMYGKKALEYGKHIFMEKPFTSELKCTEEIFELERHAVKAVHENYMLMYHSQLQEIDKILKEGILGDIRLYRLAFGFPERGKNDFRYNRKLGGGALLDCGGYTLKLADYLLGGEKTKIVASSLHYSDKYEVDIGGTATLQSPVGIAQLAFGMDNAYKCELEIWGSKGVLRNERIFTAPA